MIDTNKGFIQNIKYILVSNDIIGDDESDTNNDSQYNNKCTYGYKFFLVSCIDIDECTEGTHNCNSGEICFNYDGGYRCDQVNCLTLDEWYKSDKNISDRYIYFEKNELSLLF